MKAYFELLDTPGGQIALLVVLLFIGIGMWAVGAPKSEEVIVGAFSGLLVALNAKRYQEK